MTDFENRDFVKIAVKVGIFFNHATVTVINELREWTRQQIKLKVVCDLTD